MVKLYNLFVTISKKLSRLGDTLLEPVWNLLPGEQYVKELLKPYINPWVIEKVSRLCNETLTHFLIVSKGFREAVLRGVEVIKNVPKQVYFHLKKISGDSTIGHIAFLTTACSLSMELTSGHLIPFDLSQSSGAFLRIAQVSLIASNVIPPVETVIHSGNLYVAGPAYSGMHVYLNKSFIYNYEVLMQYAKMAPVLVSPTTASTFHLAFIEHPNLLDPDTMQNLRDFLTTADPSISNLGSLQEKYNMINRIVFELLLQEELSNKKMWPMHSDRRAFRNWPVREVLQIISLFSLLAALYF